VAEHRLKTLPIFFSGLLDGSKNFEIRKNDRNFQMGDILVLCEWDALRKEFTDRELRRTVGFITSFAQEDDYVVLGLGPAWTPCAERMPDQWQHCLVSSEFRGIQVARWDGRKWISIAQLPAALVSHWMPLPAAPEASHG